MRKRWKNHLQGLIRSWGLFRGPMHGLHGSGRRVSYMACGARAFLLSCSKRRLEHRTCMREDCVASNLCALNHNVVHSDRAAGSFGEGTPEGPVPITEQREPAQRSPRQARMSCSAAGVGGRKVGGVGCVFYCYVKSSARIGGGYEENVYSPARICSPPHALSCFMDVFIVLQMHAQKTNKKKQHNTHPPVITDVLGPLVPAPS